MANQAAEAAAALQEIATYEERLSLRTGGLTLMLWGLVSAGIFLTYGTGADWLEEREASWALALLWVPWVAAGTAATAALWKSHAIALRQPGTTRRDVLQSLAATGVFLALAAGLFVALDILADVEWTTHSIMAVANGLFAGALAGWHRRDWGRGAAIVLAAGAVMVAAGVAIGASGVAPAPAALLAAAATGSSWFAAGAWTHRMG